MLKYEFRHFQSKDNLGNPVVYSADATGLITVSAGLVPQKDWIDLTEWLLNGSELEVEYTIHEGDDESGEIDFGYNISEKIQAIGEGAKFIKNWLIKHSASHLNIVEVRITDTALNIVYPLAQIKQESISNTCDGDCDLEFVIKQQDRNRDDLDKMVIYEGFNSLYQTYPNATIPAFEIMKRKQDDTSTAIITSLLYVLPITFISALLSLLGITLPAWADIREIVKNKLGLGYAIPAPKLTTYIDNIANKIGVTVQSTFHSMIPTEGNEAYATPNKYSDVCMAYMSGDDGLDIDDLGFNVGFWRNTYAPVWSARKFLNNISKHFNLRWRLYKDTLVIRSVKWWDTIGNGTILYDFTTDADKRKLVTQICYVQTNKKQPDYIDGLYTEDSMEGLGNDTITRYNDIVDYNRYADNRVLDGAHVERSAFAPTAFYSDGIGDTDDEDWVVNWYDNVVLIGYLFLALLLVIYATLILLATTGSANPFFSPTGTIWLVEIPIILGILIASFTGNIIIANNDIKAKYDSGIIVDSKSWSNPKLLYWDSTTGYTEAQVLIDYQINSTGTSMITTPATNDWNNPIAPPVVPPFHPHYASYIDKYGNVQKHKTNNSTYKYVRNFRLMFEPDYVNNIYDDFWQYEDPNKHRAQTIDFISKISICREDIIKLGLQQATNSITGQQVSDAKLLNRIAIYYDDNNIKRYGKILHIKLSYKEMAIIIRGRIV